MASPRRSRDPVQEAAVGAQLYANWGLLALAAGPEGLPLVESVQQGRVDAVEYGRGYFGTVMPTSVPGVVFKLTTDPAEALFAHAVLATRDAAPGLVRYYRVAALAGRHGPRRDLRVFALWREEASGVGKAVGSNSVWRRFLQPVAVRREQGFAGRLDEFFVYARMVEGFVEKDLRGEPRALAAVLRGAAGLRGRVDPDAVEGERGLDAAVRAAGPDAVGRAAFALAMAEEVARRMAREPYGELVGAALHHYAREGVVLADVHEGNVGFVERPGNPRALVITDPGRAVVLTPRYRGLRIPELAALAGRCAAPSAAAATARTRASARASGGATGEPVRPNPWPPRGRGPARARRRRRPPPRVRHNPEGQRARLPVAALGWDEWQEPLRAVLIEALFAASPWGGDPEAHAALVADPFAFARDVAAGSALADAAARRWSGRGWTDLDAAFATRAVAEWWDESAEGQELLALYAYTDDRPGLVLAACACARAALPYAAPGDVRPRRAIEATEAWARGAASADDVREAREGARQSQDAAYDFDERPGAFGGASGAVHGAVHAADTALATDPSFVGGAAWNVVTSVAASIVPRRLPQVRTGRRAARAKLADLIRRGNGVTFLGLDPPEIVLPRRPP